MTKTTAELSTELLRTSTDQLWVKLREVLPSSGINVKTDVLADLFPDDTDQEFGVVVTHARRVFTFVLHYGRSGDLTRQAAEAVVSDWSDITDWWQSSPYVDQVRGAMDMLDGT